MLNMNIEYSKGILFVRLNGKLDRSSSYKINNYLVPVILKQKIKYLVYNLNQLDDLDDDGKDAILNSEYAILTNKGKLFLCDVKNTINKKLKSIHIKQLIDEQSALKEMGV